MPDNPETEVWNTSRQEHAGMKSSVRSYCLVLVCEFLLRVTTTEVDLSKLLNDSSTLKLLTRRRISKRVNTDLSGAPTQLTRIDHHSPANEIP